MQLPIQHTRIEQESQLGKYGTDDSNISRQICFQKTFSIPVDVRFAGARFYYTSAASAFCRVGKMGCPVHARNTGLCDHERGNTYDGAVWKPEREKTAVQAILQALKSERQKDTPKQQIEDAAIRLKSCPEILLVEIRYG